MKDELIIDGIRYKRIENPKELTLEDCVKDSVFVINAMGEIRPMSVCNSGKYGCYPHSSIAEKVLLYGLLQSVAYKLNGNAMFGAVPHILFLSNQKKLDVSEYHGTYTISPVFLGKETAKQAIKIFENSKFDLKKLFQ